MKKIISFLMSVIIAAGALCVPSFADSRQMRGVWVSTVTNLDFPSSSALSADEQKKELSDMFNKFAAMGINTVIFQARPCGDALYSSSINPWSQYLTGTQGKYPGYDPLEYAIEEAHKRGLQLHAWLNPYRVTMKGNTDLNSLAENNPARLNPDWVISYNDALTFNPSKDEVKQLICDTVKEIAVNYDVDAIHFDDYFYPAGYPLTEGGDGDSAEADKRRENVNDMVRMVSETINTYAPDVEFGISPMGIWKNDTVDGYEIKGSQSYYTVYGDTVTWIKNGWIDYVAPQIYWEDSHATASYGKLVKWWNNIVEGTGVKLYIGEAVYKDIVAAEMGKHFDIDAQYKNVSGNIFFRAKMLLNDIQSVTGILKSYYLSSGNTQNEINTGNSSSLPEGGSLADANGGSLDNDLKTKLDEMANRKIEEKTAVPTSSEVKVDGIDTGFEAYNIDGYNYFKLRDIAYALNGSEKQFDTVWDSENSVITIDMGKAYTVSGGELEAGNGRTKTALTSTALVVINGDVMEAEAYNIDGMNYYKLRDVAKAVDFGVAWSDALNSIGIFTMVGYEE